MFNMPGANYSSNCKKQKRDNVTFTIPTSNLFTTLATMMEPEENRAVDSRSDVRKPPLIYIHNLTNINIMLKLGGNGVTTWWPTTRNSPG